MLIVLVRREKEDGRDINGCARRDVCPGDDATALWTTILDRKRLLIEQLNWLHCGSYLKESTLTIYKQ